MSGRLADYLVRGLEEDLPDPAAAAAAPNAAILRFFRADDTGNLFVLDRALPAWVRVNIPATGWGNAAERNVGTAAGTVAAGDDARIVGALQPSAVGTSLQAYSADLSAIAALASTAYGRALLTLADAEAARSNFQLGNAATAATGTSGHVLAFLDAANTISAQPTIAHANSVLQILSRTGSAQNATEEFRTTAGSVFIGNYNGAGFAIGPSNNLASVPTQWATVTASGINTAGAVAAASVTATGGSLTGLSGLGVTTTGNLVVPLSAPATSFSLLRYSSAGSNRFDFGKDNTAETGLNAGSNFIIRRCADSGTVLSVTFMLNRANGDLTTDGNILPLADNAKNLGSGTYRWSVIYAGTGTINTSDERAKRDISALSDDLLDAWANVDWKQFRFKDAYEDKGDAARWHLGLIAQQVRDAIDARLGDGEAIRFGLVCHDVWEATEARWSQDEDEDGEPVGEPFIVTPAMPAGDRWGLRYDECFAVEAAYQRRRMDRIEALLAS
jgi:hypothetical protein